MALPFDPARIDWNLLRAFGAVMQAGSLTAAASQLASSQPTLSRQIAQLEALLGAPLFERGARGLRPTVAAQALAEPTARMLAAAQACAVEAGQTQGRQNALAGSVRLTASRVVSCHVLPELLRALAQGHPAIEIELVASDRLDKLLEHEADIAVRMVRPTQSALITRHLADWPLGLYIHRDLRPAGHPPDRPLPASAVPGLRKVGFDQDPQMLDGYRSAGLPLTRHDFPFRCDDQVAHLAAVRAGLGLGVVLAPLARRCPELLPVALDAPLPMLPVWLTAHGGLRNSLRIRTVFDHLAAELTRWGQAAPPQPGAVDGLPAPADAGTGARPIG